ncbi:protein mono-ADP-ribosyltransferase PARP14-like isoform X2 [Haliotis asinina]|uniref:protein mono-ADP-ribosyltransferase PARP14-like isoform X2 n=1 Tax=Haliotis asinina TaxID=109174 RepID=UPI0035327954
MSSLEVLASRSVLITGLPDNVVVSDFVKGYLTQNGIKKSAEAVDSVGESDVTKGKPGFVVLLKSTIDARKILVEHQVSECRYEMGVATISAAWCPKDLIPAPWLEDPPRYNTLPQTTGVKVERPPSDADRHPPPKDTQTEEQMPLPKPGIVCDPVVPEKPQQTLSAAELSVNTRTEDSFHNPRSSPNSDVLKHTPAQTPGYHGQIPKSQPPSQISSLMQTPQQNIQEPRYHAPQRNFNGPQNMVHIGSPGGSPRQQSATITQNIPPGPAPGMPGVCPPQNFLSGQPRTQPYPGAWPPYYHAPRNLPPHPQLMQPPVHPQYSGRIPQPDPGRFQHPNPEYSSPSRGPYPLQRQHPTQGPPCPFPTQLPYANPMQGPTFQFQMQSQPYNNQTQAQPFQHPPFLPYGQGPYPPAQHYPQANYPTPSYPEGPPMHPQGAPSITQRYPLPNPQEQHSEHLVPETTGDQQKQEQKPKAAPNAGPTILEVRGIKPSMTEDSVNLYFENKRKSGGGEGEVIKVVMKKRKKKALVFFNDPETAGRVLKKKSHLINKHSVEVLAYTEPSGGAADNDSESGEDGDTDENCTIEVRRFKPSTTGDTLEYYFENTTRSGGGPVANCEKKDDVIFITFESPEVAQNVLGRKHVVDKTDLTVKLHRPTPCYKNRFFVTNIGNTTSKDNVMSFLEARARVNVTEVLYGLVPGNALVTFEDDSIPDFEKLQLQCRNKLLEGRCLHVEKVPISDSVVVRGLKKESTEETLQLYFENKKSGNTDGTPVTVSTHDDGYCIVRFEDYRAIDKILSKQHRVEGAKLSVKLYVERLGLATEDTDGSWYKQPQPFTVENLDKPKCRFLQSSRTDKDKLKQSLKERHAEITWLSDYSATMTCTLNKDAKDAVKLAQSWHRDTEEFLRTFVDRFQTEEYTTLDQIWEEVRKDLNRIPESKSVLMDLCDEDHRVIVVGHSADVQKVGAKVKATIKGVENEFQRKQKEITERITNLKPRQLKLLVMDGYVADMKSRYPTDLKVTVNAEQNEVTFRGQVSEINECKISLYERIANYNSQTLTLSQRLVSFLDKRDVKDTIMNKFRDMKINGVWDIDSKTQTATVMATTKENTAFLGRKLKDMIVEHHENIDRENTFLLSSDEFAAFEKATLDKYGSLVALYTDRQASHVAVVAFENTIDQIREELHNFIQQNSVYRQIVKLPGPIYRFLLENGYRELTKISHDLAEGHGKLDESTAQQIKVSGCQEVLTKAVQDLRNLAEKVIHKKYTLKKPGISKFINSKEGKSVIGLTERDTRCIIELSFDESVKVRVETIGSGPSPVISVPHGRSPSGTRVIATCDIDSKRRIHVVIGDITAMEVDVIVNAANNRLDHIGGLARAIADKGGPTIQKESHDYIARNKTLRAGDVVTTGSGRLPCKMVAHAVGPCWSGGHHGEEGDLKDAIMLSLEHTDRNGYKSIALPALSSGIFGYPLNLATRHIVEAIKKFYTLESPNSDVTNVYMIDTNERTTSLFTAALQEVYSDRRVTLTESISTTHVRPPVAKKPKPVARGARALSSNRSKTSQSCKVTIVRGEIAKRKVDALINSTSNNLHLNNGAVSRSILKAAGKTIQQELLDRYPQGIQTGDVAVSSGGNLGCRVYHVCLPSARTSGSEVLQNIIVKCLQTAADEGCKTVAFPALGTGNLGYAANFVAQTMYTAVNTFQKKNTSLEEVQVVIYPTEKEVIQAFEEYERRVQTGEITDRPVVAYDHRSFQEEESFEDSWISQMKDDGLHIGRLNLQIKQGDITQEDADCIINSTNPELDLKRGAVSTAIATACGKDMESQCKMKLEAMRQNGVVSTTSKGLKCKYVLHVAGDHFSNDWKKVVLICLKEAEKLGDAHSVAFPVLGTGTGHVSPREISKIMVQAFAEFEPEASNLADIRVVVFQQPMFLTVSTEIQKSVNSMNQGTPRRTSKTGRSQVSEDHTGTITDSSGVQFGNITVTIKQGDITKEDTDCIVNSTNSELDLNKGAVSGAIKKACGKDIEVQCAKKVEDMRQHGVVSTTAKGLKCKYVLHVAGDHFGNDWKKVVLCCLDEAEKLPGAQSVSFPFLGTGIQSIEPEDIAKMMFQAFAEFGSRAVSVCDVRVVVFQQALLKAFAGKVKLSADTGATPKPTLTLRRGTAAPGSVELYFFSDHSDAIASGIKKLEDRCQKEWSTKTLDNDPVIPKLTDQQIQNLHQNFDVELKLDRTKGVIQLTGQRSVVDEVCIKVLESLRNIEKEESETERASLLSQTVQWAYFEKDKTVDKKDFDSKENAAIEKAFRNNEKSCKVNVKKTTIEIDFSSMEGNAKKTKYSIIRRDLMQEAKQSIFDPPSHWQSMADDVNVHTFPVAADDAEFKIVAGEFMKTINNSNATIQKVERIQNRSLYQQYTAKTKQLERQNPQGTQNESWLWHGTSTDAIDSINAHGFNRSYCGKNATAYGQGVYFAVGANYSAQDTYSRPDTKGQKYMYLVRVLTGEYTKGAHGMRVPPTKAGSTVLFDSVVNDINNPAMYIVFNDTQAYPDYLVTFHL